MKAACELLESRQQLSTIKPMAVPSLNPQRVNQQAMIRTAKLGLESGQIFNPN
ncbi:MAG: hypothetical protein RJA81_2086, partial [Planctomycetota bacterium]